ncbi:MAG: glycosyltransferase family 4 protein [Actinomycetota bacterium]|nr:glycosyltransferase family 4 protein [Actinomycetota bacterium]
MPRHDVAIYAPFAARLYERRPSVTGGAERQTTLLAAGLARLGLRVAHIVLPVEVPGGLPPGVRLVERQPFGAGKRGGRAREMARIWRALAEADADTYVFRSGLPALGINALFCRLRDRQLVFSSANNLDFTFSFLREKRPELEMYRFGVRRADAVAVQSGDQAQLARTAFPTVERVVEIPSFAEPAAAAEAPGEAFLWAGRLDEYKQPVRYLELAERLPESRFWMVPKFLHERPTLADEVRERAARLPNLEVLDPRPHAEAMRLVERSVAIVNTGAAEGMPNFFLEAWARGVPVLSFEFDPDGRIEGRGLGISASGSWERFEDGARELWRSRASRSNVSSRVRGYVEEVHGLDAVSTRWRELLESLADR